MSGATDPTKPHNPFFYSFETLLAKNLVLNKKNKAPAATEHRLKQKVENPRKSNNIHMLAQDCVSEQNKKAPAAVGA